MGVAEALVSQVVELGHDDQGRWETPQVFGVNGARAVVLGAVNRIRLVLGQQPGFAM
nr:hypothetical protein [Mycolicibacterium septicum]